MKMMRFIRIGALLTAVVIGLTGAIAGPVNGPTRPALLRPNERPPDTSKPVKVFILMGQSNMVGMGDIEPETKPGTLTQLTRAGNKYPFLVAATGQWTVRRDVYYYDARLKKGSHLSATSNNGKAIGPELGFGFVIGQMLDEPVLIIKSCIGNRSLGWDLLPPGSERYVVAGKTYAGYRDTPDSWIEGQPRKVVNWYAGKQYDDDQANVKTALTNLAKIYPDYQNQGFEIAGFVWWQGHKDQNAVHARRYEQNLARLITALRKDYQSPHAMFVVATGCGNPGRTGFGLEIAEAQLAVGDAKQHPEFAGNVAAVDSRDLWREVDVSPKNQGYHYNRNAETYLEVGLRLGWAMADLLKGE